MRLFGTWDISWCLFKHVVVIKDSNAITVGLELEYV